MNLLMITGDRAVVAGKRGPFLVTLQGLSQHFERIDVLCPFIAGNCEAWRQLVPENVHMHPAPVGMLRHSGWVSRFGTDLVKRYGHKVATVQASPPFHHAWGALRLRKKTGIPVSIEVHHIVGSPVAATTQEHVARILSRIKLPWLTKRFQAVRVVNKGMVDHLKQWGVQQSLIHVVPSFYLDTRMRDTVGDVPQSVDLAFCSRLVANKNLPLILRTLQLLPHATLVVIGDGPKRAEWEALARSLGVSPRVTFRGWLPRPEDVLRMMKSARIFVQPSLSEGGPRVALEAMMLGLPVVSTKVGVMPDVIVHGQNGFLAESTPEAFAEVIRPLLANPELRATIGNNAMHITEQHERDTSIARYARFLQSIA